MEIYNLNGKTAGIVPLETSAAAKLITIVDEWLRRFSIIFEQRYHREGLHDPIPIPLDPLTVHRALSDLCFNTFNQMAFEMAQYNHRMQELLNQLGLYIDHYLPNYVPATIPHTNELITALRDYFEPVPLIGGQLRIHDLYGAGLPYIKRLMDNAIVKHKAQIESA